MLNLFNFYCKTPCGVPKFRPPECDDIGGYSPLNDL